MGSSLGLTTFKWPRTSNENFCSDAFEWITERLIERSEPTNKKLNAARFLYPLWTLWDNASFRYHMMRPRDALFLQIKVMTACSANVTGKSKSGIATFFLSFFCLDTPYIVKAFRLWSITSIAVASNWWSSIISTMMSILYSIFFYD